MRRSLSSFDPADWLEAGKPRGRSDIVKAHDRWTSARARWADDHGRHAIAEALAERDALASALAAYGWSQG